MKCLPNKFIKVTDHYGYRFEEEARGCKNVFVVYRVNDNCRYPISGYILRGEAIKCCKYLEKLNEEKFKKEKNK